MSKLLRFSLAVAAFALISAPSSTVLAGGALDPVVNDDDEFGPSSEPSPIQDDDEESHGTTQSFSTSGESSGPSLLLVPVDGEEDGTPGTEPGGDSDGDETF